MTMIDAWDKVESGQMTEQEYDRVVNEPLTNVNRAMAATRGERPMAREEGAALLRSLQSGDPLVGAALNMQLEEQAQQMGVDPEEHQKKFFEELFAMVSGQTAAEMGPGGAAVLEQLFQRMVSAGEEQKSLGEQMREVGELQNKALAEMLAREHEQLERVLENAAMGLMEAADLMKDAGEDLLKFRGMTTGQPREEGPPSERARTRANPQAVQDIRRDPEQGMRRWKLGADGWERRNREELREYDERERGQRPAGIPQEVPQPRPGPWDDEEAPLTPEQVQRRGQVGGSPIGPTDQDRRVAQRMGTFNRFGGAGGGGGPRRRRGPAPVLEPANIGTGAGIGPDGTAEERLRGFESANAAGTGITRRGGGGGIIRPRQTGGRRGGGRGAGGIGAGGNVIEELRQIMKSRAIANSISSALSKGGDSVARKITEAFQGAIPSKIEMTGQLGVLDVRIMGGEILQALKSDIIGHMEKRIYEVVQEQFSGDKLADPSTADTGRGAAQNHGNGK